IFCQPGDSWTFSFGLNKLPGNRHWMNSSEALQVKDRANNNADFTSDREYGLQADNLDEVIADCAYSLKADITTGEGRNETQNSDTGLAYTGKVELFPLGPFKNNGSFFEGDIAREPRPKLMFSAAYSYNNKASKSQGQLGSD